MCLKEYDKGEINDKSYKTLHMTSFKHSTGEERATIPKQRWGAVRRFVEKCMGKIVKRFEAGRFMGIPPHLLRQK